MQDAGRYDTVNLNPSEQANIQKDLPMKSNDGCTKAREKKNNLLHRRYTRLGGRTADDIVVGCDPALKYICDAPPHTM